MSHSMYNCIVGVIPKEGLAAPRSTQPTISWFGSSSRFDLEATSEVFSDLWCMIKVLSEHHPFENLIIQHKSEKTSEVTSKSIWKNFKTMNFGSDFEVIRGISVVKKYVFMISDHIQRVMEVLPSTEILQGLSELREEGLLCDITLQAEGKTISAHRALLAAVSPYFKALFTGGFREDTQTVIELKQVSFQGLKNIVDCCYTSRLELNTENVSNIISTANMFQISKIVNQCTDFMTNHLDEDTCLTFLNLAEKFNLSEVRQKANEFILENFVAVRHCDDFLDLQKDALIQYLSHDELNVNQNEAEVFYAAKDWLVSLPSSIFSQTAAFVVYFGHLQKNHRQILFQGVFCKYQKKTKNLPV